MRFGNWPLEVGRPVQGPTRAQGSGWPLGFWAFRAQGTINLQQDPTWCWGTAVHFQPLLKGVCKKEQAQNPVKQQLQEGHRYVQVSRVNRV